MAVIAAAMALTPVAIGVSVAAAGQGKPVAVVQREVEPGDDHGGHGRGGDDPVTDTGGREAEPGDDHGGHGRGGDDGPSRR